MSVTGTNKHVSTETCWPVVNQQLLQAVPHIQQTLSQLINVMNSGLIHTLLKERPNGVIAHLQRAFNSFLFPDM